MNGRRAFLTLMMVLLTTAATHFSGGVVGGWIIRTLNLQMSDNLFHLPPVFLAALLGSPH